jgi:hypothetical protein
MGLFTEFFCYLSPHCVALGNAQLVYSSSGSMNEITTYYLVLYLFLYYMFRLGFVVIVLTLLWLFNFL